MPHQVQALEGTAFNNPSMIYRSNSFWKSSLRCSLLSERNFSCRIKGVFFIESPFSVHLVVICVTSVYFQSAKFRTFQIFHAKYCKTFKISLKHFCCNGTIILSFYGKISAKPSADRPRARGFLWGVQESLRQHCATAPAQCCPPIL